jgi:GT2 family glycosyltransferase
MEYPLVSIITVNYNHPEVTVELIKSLQKITYPNIEIIVVDNASQESPAVIQSTFSNIIFIQNTENLGFAGGNNTGVRLAKGKYILFINNDTEVMPDFLEPLVAKCESNDRIGAVSPKIRFFYQPDTIQFSGQGPINPYTMRSFGYGYGATDIGQFDSDSTTNFVHGAAMLVPLSVIEKIGLMPECYFLYYEELDWCTRIKAAGYQLWYVHNSVVLHKESISTGKLTPFKTYYMNRSRLLYLRRNLTGLAFLVSILFQIFAAIPKNALVFAFRKDAGHLKAYLKAIFWHLKHLFSSEIHMNPLLK